MIKQSLRWAVMIAAVSTFSSTRGMGQAVEAEKKNATIEQWFTMKLKEPHIPSYSDKALLTKAEVSAKTAEVLGAYKKACITNGWDKQLLPNPAPIKEGGKPEVKASKLLEAGKEMPYTILVRGKRPPNGYPLFISMHGGGQHHGKEKLQGPHGWAVNTREWETQVIFALRGVYEPAGVYFIPRMADDSLGRWWHSFNVKIFQRMIKRAVLFNEVDPNRIYMMGISQGGYGTCHLAPFLADELAAAGPMAGGMMTKTENFRNLPFRSDIGEADTMFDRIKLAKTLHESIDKLRTEDGDPKAYVNELNIQKGKGHGIDYKLTPVWLAKHTRNPYPNKIVWRCHDMQGYYKKSFYWISLTDAPEKGEYVITAACDKGTNSVNITGEEVIPPAEKGGKATKQLLQNSDLIVHLNDKLLDLDKEVEIKVNGKLAFKGKVERKVATIMENLEKRGDVNYAFPSEVKIKLKK